ncbi:MAG: DUF350 domain-containing protein [Candidatus Aminicenantes bacterium]|nr:DUF350 domain-containing protein [Candidatus Aminicenantes bacterium]
MHQIFFGIIEFLVSVLISFVLIFGSYRLFLAVTRKFDEEKQFKRKNLSVGIVLGGAILGEALIVKQAIFPVMSVIQIYVLGQEKNLGNFLEVLGLSIGYVLLSGFLALLGILFSFWLFNKMTPGIDQYEEIQDNNTAVAVFMAVVIIATCLLISSGVEGLTRALIPFPEVGTIPLR